MKVYNKTNKDVAAFFFESWHKFKDSTSIQATPLVAAYLGWNVKANSSKDFNISGSPIIDGWNGKDKFYVGIYEKASDYIIRNYIPDNLDEISAAVFTNGLATENQMSAVYDAIIDTDSNHGLIGFAGKIPDDDGWLVFWGEDYECQFGTGKVVFDDPTTVRHRKGQTIHDVPAIVKFNGKYYHFSNTTKNETFFGRSSSFSTLDDADLDYLEMGGQRRINTTKVVAPIVFNNKLYVFYQKSNTNQIAYTTTTDGRNWSNEVETPFYTEHKIGVTLKGSTLYMAFTEINGHTIKLTQTRDAINWTRAESISGSKSKMGPSLCNYKNDLYVAYRSSENDKKYWQRQKSSGKWTSKKNIGDSKIGDAITLTVVGDLMYTCYRKDNSNRLYIKHYDGDKWSEHRKIEDNILAARFATIIEGNTKGQMYLGYREDNTNYIGFAEVKGLVS